MKRAMFVVLSVSAWILPTDWAGEVHAAVIYQTGFENPPFTAGPIAGQDGWNVFSASGTPNAATVQSAVVKSGLQAVEIDAALTSAQTGPFRFNLSSPSDTIVVMEVDAMLTSSSVMSAWQFAGFTASLDFMGGFNPLTDGRLQLITAGFPLTGPVITRDTWNHWAVRYDFTTQTFDVLINDTLVAASVPFLTASTSYGEGIIDTFSGAGANDRGYFDNYSVTGFAVPEPASLVLSGIGIIALVGYRRRRGALA